MKKRIATLQKALLGQQMKKKKMHLADLTSENDLFIGAAFFIDIPCVLDEED